MKSAHEDLGLVSVAGRKDVDFRLTVEWRQLLMQSGQLKFLTFLMSSEVNFTHFGWNLVRDNYVHQDSLQLEMHRSSLPGASNLYS